MFNMRFCASLISLWAVSTSGALAQSAHLPGPLLRPYICDTQHPGDATAGIVSQSHHLVLSITTQEESGTNTDNAGAVIDRVAGVKFNELAFDFEGTCDGNFEVDMLGGDPLDGPFATCLDATAGATTNGFTHLTFRASNFGGLPAGFKLVQIYIVQLVTDAGSRQTLVKNVTLNGRPVTIQTRPTGCQF
jgi:hypothetical protein